MTQLSKHYTVEDCEHSDTAIALNIPNKMNVAQLSNAKNLLNDIAEPICEHYGILITYSCLFRCFRLNSKLGGSSTSEHCNANAFDGAKFGKITLKQVFNDIVDGKIKDSKGVPIKNKIDQMIFETKITVDKKTGKKTYTYWLHIGRRDKPRHQFMTSVNNVYTTVNHI
ncbi:MAG: D-Ala-D-Ala carboxypeptidase family metallohydrolase [bacterium]